MEIIIIAAAVGFLLIFALNSNFSLSINLLVVSFIIVSSTFLIKVIYSADLTPFMTTTEMITDMGPTCGITVGITSESIIATKTTAFKHRGPCDDSIRELFLPAYEQYKIRATEHNNRG